MKIAHLPLPIEVSKSGPSLDGSTCTDDLKEKFHNFLISGPIFDLNSGKYLKSSNKQREIYFNAIQEC